MGKGIGSAITASAVLLIGVLLGQTNANAGTPITIIANPGPFESIEAAAVAEEKVDWWDGDPADDHACTESFAAAELRRFLAKGIDIADGQLVLQSPDGDLPESGIVVILGTRSSNPMIEKMAALASPPKVAPASEESFLIYSVEEGGRTVFIIEGADRIGCLYGAYEFLEQVGYRFFGLGDLGTVLPPKGTSLPDRIETAGAPAFQSRGFWAWEDRGSEEFLLWMARNRMNYWSAAQGNPHFCKKIGLRLVIGGHTPYKLFMDPDGEYPYDHPLYTGDESKPADPYPTNEKSEFAGDQDGDGSLSTFEAHPEWYGLLGGKRQREMDENFGACNVCTSNTDGIDFLARNFVESLIDGVWKYADIVNFWALDNRPWCECDHCKAVGPQTVRLLMVVHQVQKVMKEAQDSGRLSRKVLLHSCAYHETLAPPDRPLPADFDAETIAVTLYPIGRTYTHALGDPNSTEANLHHADHFIGWTRGEYYKGSVCVGEYYNVSRLRNLPTLYSKTLAVDIPWYYRNGARHFQYMHVLTQSWGTWTLNQRMMAQLLWNPHQDAQALLDDYFEKFHPTTTENTRQFYHHLENAMANVKAMKHYLELDDPKVKYYSLRNQIDALKEDLFPLKTLQYDHRSPVTDSGVSLVESISELALARKALDAALLECSDPVERDRLLETESRFAYGEAIFHFYNHMVRALMFHHRSDEVLARLETKKASQLAEKLRTMVEVVQGAGSHGSDVNGFEAAQLNNAYEFLMGKYGDAAAVQVSRQGE